MEKQRKSGAWVSVVGMVLNLVLSALKIVTGALTGLISVVADGLNNVSDLGSGVVAVVSFHVSGKPADKEHPYGHRRAEYVASMAIALFIFVFAVELLKESITRIVSGQAVEIGLTVYVVLSVSIAVKLGMFFFYRITAKKYCSDVLKACAVDSASDCVATLVTLVGALVSAYTPFSADGYVGILVALFIGYEGVGVFKEASSKLLGQAPDEALKESVLNIVKSGTGVLGCHDLMLFGYGEGAYYGYVHIEMDADTPAIKAHAVIDGIERDVAEATGVKLSIHLDPVQRSDEETLALKARLEELKELYPEWGMHDFRIIQRGKQKHVCFDLSVPYAEQKSEEEIRAVIEAIVPPFEYVLELTVDRV